jgi:hypothetical protein
MRLAFLLEKREQQAPSEIDFDELADLSFGD